MRVAPGPGAAAGAATHYCNPQPDGACRDGTGRNYQGQALGCGVGVYDTNNPTIAAAAYDLEGRRYRAYGCGARLRVTGPAGYADVVVRDACPGCAASTLDLSEAAHALVCGQGAGTCRVSIEWRD